MKYTSKNSATILRWADLRRQSDKPEHAQVAQATRMLARHSEYSRKVLKILKIKIKIKIKIKMA